MMCLLLNRRVAWLVVMLVSKRVMCDNHNLLLPVGVKGRCVIIIICYCLLVLRGDV